MAERVSFSGQNIDIAKTAVRHGDTESALILFFSSLSPSYAIRFAGYRPDEVRAELSECIAELERNTIMTLLGAVEAAFRIDYLQRCYQKKKDEVSRRFRKLHRDKAARASLEDDIFEVWRTHEPGSQKLIGELRGAFKFRHWMAHGRYWAPKLGQKYDYPTVYQLVSRALSSLPLISS